MKSLNEDDKETLTILAVFGICIVILSLIAAITATIRTHDTTPKKYVEECKVNYIKYPLKECWYKEVK
jgi:hypothetical protein